MSRVVGGMGIGKIQMKISQRASEETVNPFGKLGEKKRGLFLRKMFKRQLRTDPETF